MELVGCGCSWLSIYPCHVCRSPAGTQCRQPVSLVACACLYLQPSRHTSQPRIVSGILHTYTRQSLTLSGLVHDDLFNRIVSSKTRPVCVDPSDRRRSKFFFAVFFRVRWPELRKVGA